MHQAAAGVEWWVGVGVSTRCPQLSVPAPAPPLGTLIQRENLPRTVFISKAKCSHCNRARGTGVYRVRRRWCSRSTGPREARFLTGIDRLGQGHTNTWHSAGSDLGIRAKPGPSSLPRKTGARGEDRGAGWKDQASAVQQVTPDRCDLDAFYGPRCDSGSPRDSPVFLLGQALLMGSGAR